VVTTDRRAARHQATKQRILAEAWGLAREQGLAGISLRDLAARVDLRQPSLYSYFASKDALYDAMFAEGYEQLLADIDARVFSEEPLEQVREMAHAFSETCSDDPVRAQLLFQRTLPRFEPTAESYALATRFLDEARRRLHAAGFTRPEDLDIFTAVIGGLVSQQLANEPGGTRWLDLTDEIVDMYLNHTAAKGRTT
jgi:AcrR family transcriptional regulator